MLQPLAVMPNIRPLTVAIAILLPALGLGAATRAATPSESAITCSNPASGTTWQINVDYDHNKVDAYTASISDSTISWHDDKDGGNYSLDRKSGNLTFTAASSTGGYIIFDRCSLDKPG
jgi:hypothetical protein